MRRGSELVAPASDDLSYIHDIYINELLKNRFLPETRLKLLRVIDRLIDQQGVDSIILAGTELPLVLAEIVTPGCAAPRHRRNPRPFYTESSLKDVLTRLKTGKKSNGKRFSISRWCKVPHSTSVKFQIFAPG